MGDSQEFDCFNLSDVFEYMSPDSYTAVLNLILKRARPGARLAYWNMLALRRRPESFAGVLHSLEDLSERLFARDRAFFYSALVIEEAA